MKRSLLLFFPLLPALLNGQDYIITWANDTLACTFPAKPGKEGLRPAIKFENGHIRTLALFPNDSMRVLEAGQIKAYYRKEHGRYLLCDGFFESRKVINKDQLILDWFEKRGNAAEWYFMNRVVVGKYVTLYVIYTKRNKYPEPVYFLSKYNDPDPLVPTMLGGKRKMKDLFPDQDVKDSMHIFLSEKKGKQYIAIIKEYNRLKEAASLKIGELN